MRLSRFALAVLALAAAGAGGPSAVSAADPPPGVQVVKAADITDKIERAAPSPGGRGGVIAQDEGYRIHVAERTVPGQAEMHEGDTDVWYVIAGAATVVTGGTIASPSTPSPGEHRGPAIQGGTEMAVAAGDVVTIRPGVPHWVKAVDGRLRYLTVKVHVHAGGSGAR